MYLLEEDLKFPKDSFKSMKYQPYEMKPSFSMVRVYQWWNYWYGEVYISFSGGLDSTVLAYIVCQAFCNYINGTEVLGYDYNIEGQLIAQGEEEK